MAQILDLGTDQTHHLRTHHTFGRDANAVDTAVNSPMASRIHAALEWNGRNWLIRDLSRNGTWLQGQRIAANVSVPIVKGAEFGFGHPELPHWRLIEDSEPSSLLLGVSSGSPAIKLRPYVFLPDGDSPELVIVYSNRKQCWFEQSVEAANDRQQGRRLEHGDLVTCAGRHWRVFFADSGQLTEQYAPLENKPEQIEFLFDLSLDEENTTLQLRNQDRLIDLGERSHHYLLLHLARQRATDAGRGLDSKTQGWISTQQLTKDLGMDLSHINIMIYRARKQLAHSLDGSFDTESLVERGKGRVRFGYPTYRIYKGQKLSYQMPQTVTEAQLPT